VLVVAAVVTVVVLNSGGGAGSNAGPSSGTTGGQTIGEPGPPFAFADPKIQTFLVRKRAPVPDLAAANQEITDALSHLYDQGVVSADHWRNGPPATVWAAFAPAIRSKAQSDRSAFTIGSSGSTLRSLNISSSSLTIRYLIDDRGKVASAQASATIRGTGEMDDSAPVDMLVTGRFLFEPISGRWLITGYPAATVTVASPAATPPAGPSGSATP
jgi:hypothetical protein